jgi:hypothetical protein
MAINQNLVAVGTINSGATTIYADVSGLANPWMGPIGQDTWVTLSTDYAMVDPPGFPTRPSFTGSSAAFLQYPRTLASGTRFQTFACEATALVAAAAAAYS